jgi:hypothetical protein
MKLPENGVTLTLGTLAMVAGAGLIRRGLAGSRLLDPQGQGEEQEPEYEYPDETVLQNEAVITSPASGKETLTIEGKHIGKYSSVQEALGAFWLWTRKHEFYPMLYLVNERGNVTLIDYEGNELASWV